MRKVALSEAQSPKLVKRQHASNPQGKQKLLVTFALLKLQKQERFFCRARTASLSKMTVSDGPQATQRTRCHPGSLSHPVFLFLAQPHDDVQVPHSEANLDREHTWKSSKLEKIGQNFFRPQRPLPRAPADQAMFVSLRSLVLSPLSLSCSNLQIVTPKHPFCSCYDNRVG